METYFKMLDGVEVRDDIIGSLDVVGMLPNIPGERLERWLKRSCRKMKLCGDERIGSLRTYRSCLKFRWRLTSRRWMDRYIFKGMVCNWEVIGKSIFKSMAGIYMYWFEKSYVFNEDSRFKNKLFSGKDKWMMYC